MVHNKRSIILYLRLFVVACIFLVLRKHDIWSFIHQAAPQKPSPPTENKMSFDIYSDPSIDKFISSITGFIDPHYTPSDLVLLSWTYIANSKANLQLRREAAWALEQLADAFYSAFQKKLYVVSAYRSYEYQVGLAAWCLPQFCARPGHSEHQAWLAVDLFDVSNQEKFLANTQRAQYFVWLQNNAHRFGWHNSYQRGVAIDSYNIEPWHRRYLWTDLATVLHDKHMTFAEWILDPLQQNLLP